MSEANVNALETTQWESFDTFVAEGCGLFWTFHFSDENWQVESACNCPRFLKHYTCKHVMMIAIRKEVIRIPRAVIPTLIGEKPKRGRQKKQPKHYFPSENLTIEFIP